MVFTLILIVALFIVAKVIHLTFFCSPTEYFNFKLKKKLKYENDYYFFDHHQQVVMVLTLIPIDNSGKFDLKIAVEEHFINLLYLRFPKKSKEEVNEEFQNYIIQNINKLVQ